MASRYFTQFFYSFFKKPVLLAGKVPLSAAAAVGTVAIKGVTSVAKTGTGNYTVTFDDKYYSLVNIHACVLDSAQDLAVDFKTYTAASKTIIIQTKVAGVVADVSDACDVYVSFLFNDTSV